MSMTSSVATACSKLKQSSDYHYHHHHQHQQQLIYRENTMHSNVRLQTVESLLEQCVGHWTGCPSLQESTAMVHIKLEMWANAQRDGRPAEYRWRLLFNAAKFG